jgi:hypothetical protein
VVASIALANAFPTRRLARETRIAAVVGLGLGYALMLATGFADGWQAPPIALTGLATVVGIDLLATGAPERTAAGPRRRWLRSRCSSVGRAGAPARWSEQSPSRSSASGSRWR